MRQANGVVNRVVEIYLAGAIDKQSGECAKMTTVDEYTRKLIQADRRRQAIKLMADSGYCRSVLVCDDEVGLDCQRPLDEQSYRRIL